MPIHYLLIIKTSIKKIIAWKTESLDIKPLVWKKDTYRCRIWKYRIIYTIEKWIVIIRKIGSRWDIYK